MNLRRAAMIPHITAWVLVAGAIAVILYDTWASTSAGQVQTISTFFREVSAHYPILSFSLGVLIGHLLWPGSANGWPK
jgi:hypothetical protein